MSFFPDVPRVRYEGPDSTNPLSFRHYDPDKVVEGKRSMIKGVSLKRTEGWHTLRMVMTGDHIECYHGGKKYLDVRDTTFPETGKIGLWSKSDARSQFNHLTLKGLDDDDDEPGEKQR